MPAVARTVRSRVPAAWMGLTATTILLVAGCASGSAARTGSGGPQLTPAGQAAAVTTPSPAASSPAISAVATPSGAAAPAVPGSSGRTPQVPVSRRLRVELWGDSVSDQATHYIAFALGASGRVTPKLRTYGGTALCDWLPEMRAELNPANPAAFHPQAAIIQFSGDAFGACMHDSRGVPYQGQALIAKYASDAATAIALFSAARVPVYFASTPISRADAALGDVGVTPLGRMFSRLPARFPAGHLVRYIDASAPLLWHGHYTRTLPCAKGETCAGHWPDGTRTVVVRQADGGHFCPVVETGPVENGHNTCTVYMPGARRFAVALATPVLRDFRLT